LLWSLCYVVLRRVLQIAALRLRSQEFEELEIVVLRHELAVSARRSAGTCPTGEMSRMAHGGGEAKGRS
jgi:hypothetical protein